LSTIDDKKTADFLSGRIEKEPPLKLLTIDNFRAYSREQRAEESSSLEETSSSDHIADGQQPGPRIEFLMDG
jgi:hypothetical protein